QAKSGYYFAYTPIASSGVNVSYVVGTSPSAFNVTGVRNFCSSEDGVLHMNAGASGSVPIAAGCRGAAWPVLQSFWAKCLRLCRPAGNEFSAACLDEIRSHLQSRNDTNRHASNKM